MSYSRGYQLSQRMHDTGLDGYAVVAEMEWAAAHAWHYGGFVNDAGVTFRQVSEAMGAMVAELARVTFTPPTFLLGPGQVFIRPDDDWSMDAYSESGDAKGGDPRHPYIAVMHDIDAVLAEPEAMHYRVVVDESQDWQGITVTRDGEIISRFGGRPVVGFDGSRSDDPMHFEDEESEVASQPSESPAERALRLRRHRGTGPALPRVQEAHRPRRHT